jgi:hypothetical protein
MTWLRPVDRTSGTLTLSAGTLSCLAHHGTPLSERCPTTTAELMKNEVERRKDQMGRKQNPTLTRRGWLFQILPPTPERARKREQERPQNWWREYLRKLSKEPEASH